MLCIALLALWGRTQHAPELRHAARRAELQTTHAACGARRELGEPQCARPRRFAYALRGGGVLGFRRAQPAKPTDLNKAAEYAEAIKWTAITMLSTLVFGLALIPWKGRNASLDFFSGFLIEKILSVDNLFVFVMLFDAFKTPEEYQRKVLTIGIVSAIVMRAVMISLGVGLVQRCRPVLLVFAAILILSAIKMMFESLKPHGTGADGGEDSVIVKLVTRVVGASTTYDGSKFFTIKDGKRTATPMLLVLICIELCDVMFAVDSIPAIVGITQDTFIVLSSNIFAILGLRNLYVLLARAVQDLAYLKLAVSTILAFVGCKMLAEFGGAHVSSLQSLVAVSALLGAGILASLFLAPPPPPPAALAAPASKKRGR